MIQVIASLALASGFSLPVAVPYSADPLAETVIRANPVHFIASDGVSPSNDGLWLAQLSPDEHQQLRQELQRATSRPVGLDRTPPEPRSGLSFRERQYLRRQLRELPGPPQVKPIHGANSAIGLIREPELAVDDAGEPARAGR